MLEDKPFNHLFVARLRDFFRPGERWFRGLWEVGIALALEELLEAAEAAANGVLSAESLEWFTNDLKGLILRDPAMAASREDFSRCLAGPPGFETANWFTLRELCSEVNKTYLSNWVTAVKEQDVGSGKGKPRALLKAERAARAVAAHLLDLGFSQQFLSQWLAQATEGTALFSLPDFVAKIEHLAQIGPISYSVLILVNSEISPVEAPPDWVPAQEVHKLLSLVQPAPRRFRHRGGWLIKIDQRDPHSAAQAAFDEVDKRAARLLVGRGQRMRPVVEAYVFGEPRPVSVARASISPAVRVRSIENQRQLFSRQPTSQLDAAFELLSQMDGSASIAVAAAWASIEALLSGDSPDKAVAADRLATLVAASFPRAELTSLAARQIRYKTVLGATLDALPTNRERAQAVVEIIKTRRVAVFTDWSDQAAVARIVQLLDAPREQLEDIRTHVHRAFRRYYRQRNLVLHWGKTNPVALRACLRTGTPLLAAGVDRVAHAWFVDGMDPVRLAQKARSRIERSQHSGREITDLLESLVP